MMLNCLFQCQMNCSDILLYRNKLETLFALVSETKRDASMALGKTIGPTTSLFNLLESKIESCFAKSKNGKDLLG